MQFSISISTPEEVIPPETWERVLNFLARTDRRTPYLLIDERRLRENCRRIGRGIKNSRGFYAMKANPDPKVVRVVADEGLGFEIASEGELDVLKSIGLTAERIISSNPVKSPEFIRDAYSYGVRLFAFDSAEELEKIQALAPECRVYVRLSVPNEGSEWPLSKKFGVEPPEAVALLKEAQRRGLKPVGITFHVGSQCRNIYNWSTALSKVFTVWRQVEKEGIQLKILNIGGGYPIRYTKEVVEIEEIEAVINQTVFSQFPAHIEVHLEPGRAVIGDAGVFITRVIGKAKRADENWLYLDVGVFNGLMESIGGIRYSFVVGSRARPKKWTIAGPSCDSFDVIARDVYLPEPNIGDIVVIPSAGAYTISYASEFNGFPIPETVLLE